MNDRELEKILRGFKKVKAPDELDERLAPYLSEKRKNIRLFRAAFAVALLLIFLLGYKIIFRSNTSSFLYEPLYAAVTVPGFFETSINVIAGERLRVIFDGEIVKDTIFLHDENYHLAFNIDRGLHYLIIEIQDASGDERYTKTIDIYSL